MERTSVSEKWHQMWDNVFESDLVTFWGVFSVG